MNNSDTTSFDLWHWLIYGPAAFQAYHMGRAFYVYDPEGWHWGTVNVGGLILGAILNVIVARTAVKLPGMAATFTALKELMPKATRKADKADVRMRTRALKTMTLAKKKNLYAQVGFYILLLFSALMVGPALFILWGRTMPFPPLVIGILAGVAAVAPDIAITVGGFSSSEGQGSQTAQFASVSAKSATESGRDATAGAKSANRTPQKSERGAPELRECDLGCGMRYRWPQGKGAHMKKYHAEQCVVKGMPAGLVLPLKDKVEA